MYANLIQSETICSSYLVVLKPARQVTSWTLVSGNVYKTLFNYGHVFNVVADGVSLSETTTTPTAGQFYYDYENEYLYIYLVTPSSKTVIVTYELYIATKDAHWHRIATDTTSRQVYYDAVIIKEPTIKFSLSDSLIGYIPSEGTSISINNAEHFLENHLYESSFYKKTIDVYHWLSELENDYPDVNNIKLLYSGIMNDISYNNNKVTIQICDKISKFDSEWRNPNKSFYNQTDWPNLDPYYIGRPIRYIYGMVDSCKFINLDYQSEIPTTSNNRVWAVRDSATDTCLFSSTVPASPSSTTTRTYLTSVDGLNIGDVVKFTKGAVEYKEVLSIDRVNKYFEHSTLSVAAVLNDTLSRGTVGNITIEQDGILYKPMYIRDWTESSSNGVLTITFSSSLESNLSMTKTLNPYNQIYGRIYGKKNTILKGGSSFGSDSTTYGNLTNPSVILFDIIKNYAGFSESEINLASFTSLNSSISTQDIGFSIPATTSENFPQYKELLINIMKSCLIRMFQDQDNKWYVNTIVPLGTKDFDIVIDEILENSINYKISYKDILSEFIVSYKYLEKENTYKKKYYNSNTAKYLHGVSKQRDFITYLLNDSDALQLSRRLSYIYGDRLGYLQIDCKNRFLTSNITSIFNVELEKLLGYPYSEDVLNSRKFSVISLYRGLRNINIELTDQKGIEDNSGVW